MPEYDTFLVHQIILCLDLATLTLQFLNYNSAPTSFEFGFMLGNGNFMLAKMFVFDVKTRSVSKLSYSSIFTNFQLGVNFL